VSQPLPTQSLLLLVLLVLLEHMFVPQQPSHQDVTQDISYIKLEFVPYVLLPLIPHQLNPPTKLPVPLTSIQPPVVPDTL
jgi:hypothetical protein